MTVSNDVISSMPAARSYAGVMMLIPATTTQAGANLDIQVTPGHARVRRRGRPEQRGAHPGGRPEHRRGVQRRRRVELRARHRQRAGNLDDDVRRAWAKRKSADRRSASCRRPAATPSRAALYASNVTSGMVGNNYTDELKARGLTTPGALTKLWDYNVGVGGPIKRGPRLVLRPVPRRRAATGPFPACSPTRTWAIPPNGPTSRTRAGRPSRPGAGGTAALRLTVQPTARNKFNLFWDEQHPCQGAAWPRRRRRMPSVGPNEIICGAPGSSNPSCSATSAPEIGTYLNPYGQRVQQATWTSPVTNRCCSRPASGRI